MEESVGGTTLGFFCVVVNIIFILIILIRAELDYLNQVVESCLARMVEESFVDETRGKLAVGSYRKKKHFFCSGIIRKAIGPRLLVVRIGRLTSV